MRGELTQISNVYSREEEKRQLAELNEKHLAMMEDKQGKIYVLQSKLDNLSQYRCYNTQHECHIDQNMHREVFITEEKIEFEKSIRFLEERILEVGS